MEETLVKPTFFNRDLSWLHFNERVLLEAECTTVPLLERIKFLSIFSSNLDEFYRVRMPVLLALEKLSSQEDNDIQIDEDLLNKTAALIALQQRRYGRTLVEEIIPELRTHHIHLIYNESFPPQVQDLTTSYFLSTVLAFMQPVNIDENTGFFPNNNALYFLLSTKQQNEEQTIILNIPTSQLPRFFKVEIEQQIFIVFLDDIIRYNLKHIFGSAIITGCYSFKVTRDAELDLKDEYAGELSEQIEAQLLKRDFGLATRFLYQPNMPVSLLKRVKKLFNLKNAGMVEGGQYHNLKDFFSFPVHNKQLLNAEWPGIRSIQNTASALNDLIKKTDLIVHTPYQSYDGILRFFNEAAIDTTTREIYVTLYRVASDSKIVNALISAAKNGKKVFVLVELKARFDEANNINWAKKMKAAGIEIVNSVTALKVHAKIALVKRDIAGRMQYTGLLATGNFNESTASFYTDHILMTAHQDLLREMELLFIFLAKRVKPSSVNLIRFNHLLVAQFNLQQRFIELIDGEIERAKQNKPASITIKLNNLEEKVLISKLYEASQAGVHITLLVRSICRLIPGVKGMSENIKVLRIVDRYLEHGRIFAFHNGGETQVYLGSADWMNRNIYRRIEVCFPVYDEKIKAELLNILNISATDNVKAVQIDAQLNNIKVINKAPKNQSQHEIYQFLKTN